MKPASPRNALDPLWEEIHVMCFTSPHDFRSASEVVGSVESAGFGLLIDGMRPAREQSRPLLSLATLDPVLQISPTVEEALHDVS